LYKLDEKEKELVLIEQTTNKDVKEEIE